MNKVAAILLFILLLPLPALAGDDSLGVYLGAKAGISAGKLDGGKAKVGHYVASEYGLMLGYDFYQRSEVPLRLELEAYIRGGDNLSYDSTIADRIELYFSSAIMLQGWLDLPLSDFFRPYLGGGVGFALAEYEARRGGEHKKYKDSYSRAWMLGGGLGFNLDAVCLDIGYRYTEANHFTAEFSNLPDYDFKIRSHTLQAAVRIVF